MCKRPIEDAQICAECRSRCPICGASEERCQNPDEWMLVLQTKVFNDIMTAHRSEGQELSWFSLLDRMNEEVTKPD